MMTKTLARAMLVLAFAAPVGVHAAPTLEDAIARIDDFDDAAALVIVRDLAERGDPRAQELLGFMLLFAGTHYRIGQPADPATGIAWLARAAAQGREPAGAMLRSLARADDGALQAALTRAGTGSPR
jgi:TPR repeat protein